MATITKPPILDETGQDIVTKLNNINTQVTALNALIADLGLVSITPISQADYDNLSPTDKLNGVFDIYDAVEPMIDGDSVSYDSNTTMKAKVTDNSNRIANIIKETYADVTVTLTANQLSRVNVNATADETNVNRRLRVRANDYDIGCFVLSDGRIGLLSSANKTNANVRLFIAFYN